MRRLPRALVALTLLTAVALPVSCSLGLDEARIGQFDGGTGVGVGPSVDGSLAEASSEAGVVPGSVSCADDNGCTTTHGCLKGKCDLTRKTCVYDVCRPSACNASACDTNTRTCAAPAPYKLRATQFTLGAQILCGNCAVAVHPWLFVTLTTGVTAFNVSNPANGSPPQVPVVGLGFVPNQLVVSGSRVWMLGAASGPGPSRVPLAYVDVPADPFATKMTARTVLASYSRPAAEGQSLFARTGDSALLVGPLVAQYVSAIVEAPLVEPASLSGNPLTFAEGTGPLAATGKRLLMGGVNAGGLATFSLVDNAGTTAPQNGAVVTATEAGLVSASRRVARTADGAVFWASGIHQVLAPDLARTRAVRGYFLVPNETGPIEATGGVDIEVFDVPGVDVAVNANVVAPFAMLDPKTVMVVTQARENAAQTAVQFVRREPLGVLKEADNTTPRRHVLPVPVGAFAAATASNGVGYVVANDQIGPPATGTVYVFDPACGP